MSAIRRIARRFLELKREGRAGLVTFVTAGDPDPETAMEILRGLPAAGADLVEIGMPFSDPMADGPAIQESSLRALRAGQTMKRTLSMIAEFRRGDAATPVILMGYFNPIYAYGVERFIAEAKAAGVDGLIVVDLPPEEHDELRTPAAAAGIDMILLLAPTTGEERLAAILSEASGFVYYVAVTGITGTRSADPSEVAAAIARIRRHTSLPVAVGFGIKTAGQAAAIAATAEAAVVGSAIVSTIAAGLADDGAAGPRLVETTLSFVAELAAGVRDPHAFGIAEGRRMSGDRGANR
jgi:tryptophan synthase alpha chain